MESLQQGTGMHANFRRDFFFWLGVVILPVFWAWFTLGKRFPRWQRYLAFTWMVAALAVVAATWSRMQERYEILAHNVPVIALCVTWGLSVWLFLRLAEVPLPFQLWALAIASSSPFVISWMDRLAVQPFAWSGVILPFVPGLLHLALRRGRVRNGRVEWHFQWKWWKNTETPKMT